MRNRFLIALFFDYLEKLHNHCTLAQLMRIRIWNILNFDLIYDDSCVVF